MVPADHAAIPLMNVTAHLLALMVRVSALIPIVQMTACVLLVGCVTGQHLFAESFAQWVERATRMQNANSAFAQMACAAMNLVTLRA